MVAYLAKVKGMLSELKCYKLILIPQIENSDADTLVRLSFGIGDGLPRQVLVEYLARLSIK